MSRTICTLLMVAAAGSSLALGADGQTPIGNPTTITEPGHYVVIRDISVPGNNPVIRIEADRVTLDLNSQTLSSGSDDGVVLVSPGFREIVIRDGYILAYGATGIGGSPKSVRIERVHIRGDKGTGIDLGGTNTADVVNCVIDAGDGRGIRVSGAGVRIEGNYVRTEYDPGIHLLGAGRSEIIGNRVTTSDALTIAIEGSGGGNLLRENVVYRGPIKVATSNSLVISNVVHQGNDGILVSGHGNRLIGNVAGTLWRNGIAVDGANHLLEDNQLEANDECGIKFLNDDGHAYRNNMLRGNKEGAVCGPANTDAGGNIM